MARKYSRDSIGRFASGGGGRSSGGAIGGAAAGGKKKTAARVAAAPKKKHPGPPPPAWSKEMLAAKAKSDRASKVKAAAATPATAKARTKTKASAKAKPANNIQPSPRSIESRSLPFTAPASKAKGKPLTSAEKAYAEIRAQKSKFRSDKKVREEMMRRGFLKGKDPQGQLLRIGRSARIKQGQQDF